MEESKKIYWKGIEQLANSQDFVKHANQEFAQPGPEEDLGHSRRDFLKMMGFGMSAVALAACEAPIRNAIPYVNKPIDLDPSVPNYYASSYINGGDYCSIVVKTREGRPIKIEGNALSGVTKGGTSAQVEASVLSLYDNDRLRWPRKTSEKKGTWEAIDQEIIAKLTEIAGKGGQIRIVSNTVLSPSTKAVIEKFKAKYPTTQHVQYDQNSAYGILKANEESFGTALFPSYDFSKASVIVGIAADFIGSWGSSIENTKQYAWTREVGEDKKDMSRHYQFESLMTITGANADYRALIKPSEEGALAVTLYNLLAAKAGVAALSGGGLTTKHLSRAADELWASRGRALVVAGSNDKAVQVVVNGINSLLESYGSTILLGSPVNYRQGDDAAMANFIAEVEAGKIEGVIFYNCNPVYDHPQGAKLEAGIKGIALSVSTSYKEEETGTLTQYLAPDHHYLESWNDAEPKKNFFSLSQPAITPIFKSRSAQESFAIWAGDAAFDYFEFVKNNWKSWFYKGAGDFQSFWDKCLYDGVLEFPSEGAAAASFAGDVNAAASAITSNYKTGSTWELVIYEGGTVGNGSQANNPLLQELPDPITKAVWDHYVTVAPKDASDISFDESKTKFATITVNGKAPAKVAVLIQPGQASGTLGLALGYGRTKGGKVASTVGGVNAYPLVGLTNGSLDYNVLDVKFEKTTEDYQLAQTQTHQTYMAREAVVQETILSEFKNKSWERFEPKVSTWNDPDHKANADSVNMWKGHEYRNHHWGMAIDLNTCTGCAACVVACNVENNISLVGRQEVINRREMHWLRIDRYYSSDANVEDWKGLEKAAEEPEVVFQPMLCQHCNNAPCETVCPVAATTHSTEGLNQMAYNRCIGTRYCANNCPYKVRRFNWFKYHDNSKFETSNTAMNSSLGKMVLNPDVTVRSRGVMEKCSFCVQRIQAGKLNAKRERRPLKDGEVETACQTACSTGAIVFGDISNPESKISKLLKITPLNPDRPHMPEKVAGNPRAYQVISEIGVRPNIWYLTKVRNKEEAKA